MQVGDWFNLYVSGECGDLVRALKLYKSQTHVEPEEASKSNYAAAVII